MNNESSLRIIYFSAVLIFILFILYAYLSNVKDYINDSVIIIILLTIIYLLRKYFKLTSITFTFLILALISHNSGVFGFYANSPLPMQYDHFTHLFGLFAVSLIIFNFFKKYFSYTKLQNILMLFMILLASIGVGALVEQVEFLGFLKFGTGEGLLKFGGLGDSPLTEETLRDIDLIGGGWINTMWDLIYNFIGALTGTIIMYIIYLFKKDN